MSHIRMRKGAELPSLSLTWRDEGGAIIDFSTGWTFQLKVGTLDTAAVLTKTTGISGSVTAPNITFAWAAGEWALVPPGNYAFQITATQIASSKKRVYTTGFILQPVVL